MFRKLALIASFFIITGLQAQYFLPAGVTLSEVKKSPSKDFFHDLHDYTVIRDGIGLAGLKYAFSSPLQMAKMLVNKKTYRANKKSKKLPKQASGDAYIELFEKEGASELAKLAETMRNAYKPNKCVLDIIMQLNKQGYRQFVASNIGQRGLPLLNDRLIRKYKVALFSVLNKGLIVNWTQDGRTTITIAGNTYHMTPQPKPSDEYFKELRRLFCPDLTIHPVFIDDNYENVQAAVRNGFIGILYERNSKTADQQLCKDLNDLGYAVV